MKKTFVFIFFVLLIFPCFLKAQSKSVFKIDLGEIVVSIYDIEFWDGENNIKKFNNDSVLVYLELGEVIEENKINVETNNFKIISIRQSFETSITVMNEGPHLDLTEWKHYRSDWFNLKEVSENSFMTVVFKNENKEKFIPVEISEVYDAVKEYGGESWYEHAKTSKNIYEYPFGVGVSRYFIEIVLENVDTNKAIRKMIVFYSPLGC
jgi:hypothetical protein